MAKRKPSTPVSAPKRARKSDPDTNYVIYETLADNKVPVEDVAQGLARAVAYDADATQQVLAMLAKAAGLKGTPEIEVTTPKRTSAEIEKQCEGAPAAYPVATTRFASRFKSLVPLFFASLHESQSHEELSEILPFIVPLSMVRLRSLRHAAVAFCGPLYQAIIKELEAPKSARLQRLARLDGQLKEMADSLQQLLTKRALDVSPEIRKLAVESLPFFAPALDDESSAVRFSALDRPLDYSSLDTRQSQRILEIARSDVDVWCRVNAVSILPDVAEFLKDSEPQVCAAAAEKYLKDHQIEDAKDISHAGAVALARASKLSIDDSAELALKTDSIKLLKGACIACEDAEALAAGLLGNMLLLMDKLSHSDSRIAEVMSLFRNIDLDATVRRNLESNAEQVLASACTLYLEHPSPEIISAFAAIARPMVEHEAFSSMSRTYLNETLEQLVLSPANLVTRTEQAAGLGRFIDISDFATDEMWALSDPVVCKFAKNITFHGDKSAISMAVKYLSEQEPIPTEELLYVLIGARMRNIGVSFDANNLSLRQVPKKVLIAARAAEVIDA